MYRTALFALAALATLGFAEKHHTKPHTTKKPHTAKKHCTKTACIDYINDCGRTYGGCYEACKGYTTPSFTDPGCPSTTSSSAIATSSSVCVGGTLCVDHINDCGMMYGGCYCVDGPEPSYTDPGCPSPTTTSVVAPSCTAGTICEDPVNACGIAWGGCYCADSDSPYTDPGCPPTSSTVGPVTTITPPSTTTTTRKGHHGGTKKCTFVCSDSFDDCGNTFGPGCWTSCPGKPIPTYTTPYCSLDAKTTAN